VAATVAFFRNFNLGQGSSPTRTQLLDAFAEVGVRDAWSFQVNGTVVLEAPEGRPAQALLDEVVALLLPVCGYDDLALARPLPWLAGLGLGRVEGDAEVSFFDGPSPFPEDLPWIPPRGDLTVVRADERHAVSINDLHRRSNATRVLEHRLGVPVTSRGVPTLLRLLAKATLLNHRRR